MGSSVTRCGVSSGRALCCWPSPRPPWALTAVAQAHQGAPCHAAVYLLLGDRALGHIHGEEVTQGAGPYKTTGRAGRGAGLPGTHPEQSRTSCKGAGAPVRLGEVGSIAGASASTPQAAGQGRKPAPLSSCWTLGRGHRPAAETAGHCSPHAPALSARSPGCVLGSTAREDSCRHALRTHTRGRQEPGRAPARDSRAWRPWATPPGRRRSLPLSRQPRAAPGAGRSPGSCAAGGRDTALLLNHPGSCPPAGRAVGVRCRAAGRRGAAFNPVCTWSTCFRGLGGHPHFHCLIRPTARGGGATFPLPPTLDLGLQLRHKSAADSRDPGSPLGGQSRDPWVLHPLSGTRCPRFLQR